MESNEVVNIKYIYYFTRSKKQRPTKIRILTRAETTPYDSSYNKFDARYNTIKDSGVIDFPLTDNIGYLKDTHTANNNDYVRDDDNNISTTVGKFDFSDLSDNDLDNGITGRTFRIIFLNMNGTTSPQIDQFMILADEDSYNATISTTTLGGTSSGGSVGDPYVYPILSPVPLKLPSISAFYQCLNKVIIL